MKKIISTTIVVLILIINIISPPTSHAQSIIPECKGFTTTGMPAENNIQGLFSSYTLGFSGLNENTTYTLIIDSPKWGSSGTYNVIVNTDENGRATNYIDINNYPHAFEKFSLDRTRTQLFFKGDDLNKCFLGEYFVNSSSSCLVSYSQDIYLSNPACIELNSPINVNITNFTKDKQPYTGKANVQIRSGMTIYNTKDGINISNGNGSYTFSGIKDAKDGSYKVVVFMGASRICEAGPIPKVQINCLEEDRFKTLRDIAAPINICTNIPDETQLKTECLKCMGTDGDGEGGGVWTGLGCLKFSPSGFIKQILQIAVGLGGGIAFLLLIYGAFLMTTSAGDPKAADNAKQVITGAITGLLVIIFSVVILNIIGVQILQIPGL